MNKLRRLSETIERFFSTTFLRALTYVPSPIRPGYLRLLLRSVEAAISCATPLRAALMALSAFAMERRYAAETHRFKRGPLRPLYKVYWLSWRVSNRWIYIAARIAIVIERRLTNAHDNLIRLFEWGDKGLGPSHLSRRRQLTLASRRGYLERCRSFCDQYIASGDNEYLIPLSNLYLKWGQADRAFDLLRAIAQFERAISVGGQLDAAEMLLQLATINNALLIDERSRAGKRISRSALRRQIDFRDPSEIALLTCESVLAQGPNRRALRLRAEANYLRGHNAAAADDMTRAAKFSWLSAKEYMIWVNALRRGGEKEEAIRVLMLAVSNCTDLAFTVRLGRMLIDASRWTEGTSKLVYSLRQATRSLDQ
jgi:hypothetical protein